MIHRSDYYSCASCNGPQYSQSMQFRFSTFPSGTPTRSPHKARTTYNRHVRMYCMILTYFSKVWPLRHRGGRAGRLYVGAFQSTVFDEKRVPGRLYRYDAAPAEYIEMWSRIVRVHCVRSLYSNGPASCCLRNYWGWRYSPTIDNCADKEFEIDRRSVESMATRNSRS